MDQQSNSRETVTRLRAEREAATDPTVIAALDSQIRLHSELAGPDTEPEPDTKTRPAKTAKSES
ncbi:hypothetical protein ACTOB_001391 [Actinoplanes oblitus]|uniref:Uncharacterized protein n=1 Tax=Actinoplanes oblitus TaxID=3040509 RepID=A0ABY8WK39_9ACTN|nr:hypothetical protein [Actinoplanes oblitus]WIM97837.1 hypothetical protein ACTOB_001391 [Actinoplanes oblitus]